MKSIRITEPGEFEILDERRDEMLAFAVAHGLDWLNTEWTLDHEGAICITIEDDTVALLFKLTFGI